MLTPTLRDFLKLVPSLEQTNCLSLVVKLLSQGQSDLLVVLDEQHRPLGALKLWRLLPYLISNESGLDTQQLISMLAPDLVEPLLLLDADLSIEQFSLYVRSQAQPSRSDLALVDQEGRFLGLLDTSQLFQFLALHYPPAQVQGANIASEGTTPACLDFVKEAEDQASTDRSLLDSLAQLLGRLPWPLLLQSENGEVVAQNPAWYQQFGGLLDPEAVRIEVEAVLTNVGSEPESQEEPRQKKPQGQEKYRWQQEEMEKSSSAAHAQATPSRLRQTEATLSISSTYPEPESEDSVLYPSRCQLGSQPGTCICVWPMSNGQERVWQFVKIPLWDSETRELTLSQLYASNPLQLSLTTNLWLLFAQDVTEQQQLCKELTAKNADLIQLNRLKDEFLACISHELKTPLTAVLGLSNLLKEQTLGHLNERQARYARLIHQSSRHLMTVVNDILDLTRMETGQLELMLEPVQIAHVCEKAVEQAKTTQSKARIPDTSEASPAASTNEDSDHHFTLYIEPGLDIMVADELRLRQMLINLLSNAFKFTEIGGEVGLRVCRWEGWIAFTVWDTGIGIPEHQQHLIFQKFQQLENPLTRRFEGTGLGLVLTRALARLHGGDVSFLSKKDRGSQFTLLLPPSPPPDFKFALCDLELSPPSDQHPDLYSSPNNSKPPVPNSKLSNRLILVVEAAPRFIEGLTEQLTSLGYRSVIARSGTEALEKVRRLQPKAVFLNPLLPLLSGWDVLTLLKADALTRAIPVIVTSTRAEKKQAFLNQADDFLSLPVQQDALQQTLTHISTQASASRLGRSTYQNSSQKSLTILHLNQELEANLDSGSWILNSGLLHHHCRVLEAMDLEQAELIARVWHPDVVLLDGAVPSTLDYLKQWSEYQNLASLPLVTLDAATTQIASQIPELSVFPCLTPSKDLGIDALLSVLQIAAGISLKPNILLVDIPSSTELNQVEASQAATGAHKKAASTGVEKSEKHSSTIRSEWFQALIQYLQSAGFKGMIGRSWAEIQQQIRQKSVDLLLICLKDSTEYSVLIEQLTALKEQHNLPPILVLDQRLGQGEVNVEALETALHAIAQSSRSANATRILPHSISMEELLNQIYQTLALKGNSPHALEVGHLDNHSSSNAPCPRETK